MKNHLIAIVAGLGVIIAAFAMVAGVHGVFYLLEYYLKEFFVGGMTITLLTVLFCFGYFGVRKTQRGPERHAKAEAELDRGIAAAAEAIAEGDDPQDLLNQCEGAFENTDYFDLGWCQRCHEEIAERKDGPGL